MRPHTTKFRPHEFFFSVRRVIREEWSIFLEVIISVIVRRKFQTNMCVIPNGHQDTACLDLQTDKAGETKM
jgi:hypothetical protein